MTVQALADLKVLDLAWVIAGPLIGRALADFGATVVRVESSKRLDTARVLGPFKDGKFDPQASLGYENCNAGKLGMTLDLARPEARAVVLDLVAWADVVIESFLPGQMEKFGLGYDRLRDVNPAVILLSSSLTGQTGPTSRVAGFGNIGAALSGITALVGERDGLPIGPFGPYTDYTAPRFALATLLAALDRRRRTGEGARIDIAQTETAIALLAPQLLDYQANGRVAKANGNRDPHYAPNGVFRTAGQDRWVAITARSDAEWQKLARLVGGEALAADARFTDLAGRRRNEDALEAVIAAWAAERAGEAIERTLQAEGVPAHVASESVDIVNDPQLAARGSIVRMPHPLFGETVFDAARAKLSDTPAEYRREAPTFGRDTDQVLREILAYPPERIDGLREAGVLT